MKMKNKIRTMVDDHRNRKKYRMICRQLGRNIDKDIGSLDKHVVDLKMDKDFDYNQIVIDNNVIAQGSFRELAILYHFLKKCVYR